MWNRKTIITKFQQLTNITCQGWCMMRRAGRGGSRRQKGSARPLGALLLFITSRAVKILLLLGKGSLDGRFSLCCRFSLWSVHDDYHNDDGYLLVVMRICKWLFCVHDEEDDDGDNDDDEDDDDRSCSAQLFLPWWAVGGTRWLLPSSSFTLDNNRSFFVIFIICINIIFCNINIVIFISRNGRSDDQFFVLTNTSLQ